MVVDFLTRHGGPRAYEHPDFPAELRAAPGFHNLKHRSERVISQLSAEAFVALALSSSHARHAIEHARRASGGESAAGHGRAVAGAPRTHSVRLRISSVHRAPLLTYATCGKVVVGARCPYRLPHENTSRSLWGYASGEDTRNQ